MQLPSGAVTKLLHCVHSCFPPWGVFNVSLHSKTGPRTYSSKSCPSTVCFNVDFAAADMEDLDFNGFLKLLRVNSMDSLDSLDQYDSRLNSSANLQGLESNPSGHGNQDGHYSQLESVPE